MSDRTKDVLRRWFPNRVVLPIILAFSFDNLLDAAITTSVPERYQLTIWLGIFLVTILIVATEIGDDLEKGGGQS
jgi:hypothetical protein